MNKRLVLISILMILSLVVSVLGVAAQDGDGEATEEPMMDARMGFWDECATPENLPETVEIGAIFGLSGNISVYGVPQRQGIELAVQQINERGYLGEGTELSVIFEDSAGDSDEAVNAMTKLVEQDEVLAVIGPTLSTEAFSADPIANDAGTPVMGVSNTAIGITEMGEYVFRNSLPESSVIPGTVEQSAEVLDLERVGVLYGSDDDFTLSGYDVFVEALDEQGIEITGEETFSRDDVDFNPQLTALLADEPDALVVSALAAEAVQIINQARDLGYEGPIIGGNGFNSPAVLEETGEASNGVIVGAAWNSASDNPLSNQFIEDYQEAYDTSPDQFTTQAYTGAWLMATAIRCADAADSDAIRDALAGIEDFPSPLGQFSFADDRNPIHPPVVQVAVDGEFEVLSEEMMSAAMDMEGGEE